MAQEQFQPNQIDWPKYFLPRPGTEHVAGDAQVRLPATLIDLFSIQDPTTGSTQLVSILGCLGGHLLVVPAPAFPTLPDDLQRQIKTVEVNHRSMFRTLRVRELHVAVLDALDQDVTVQGFNDAVYLFSRLQARVRTANGALAIVPVAYEGRLTVGRLDVLQAWLQSLEYGLANPLAADEKTYHLLLPAAPRHEIEQGAGIVLMYPMLDPLTVGSSDNSFIMMRLAYEILARLQQDMLDEGIDHPLARLPLPVPSRGRLESELMAEGYAIKGEFAIKQAQATGATTGGFLAHLRHLAAQWSEPRILLPAQARPQDYLQSIDELVATVRTVEDTAMAHALSQLVADATLADAVLPTPPVPRNPSPGEAALPSAPWPAPIPQRVAPATPQLALASPGRREYARDFQSQQPYVQRSSAQADWGDDFGASRATSHVSTVRDWQQDGAFSSAGMITTKLVDPPTAPQPEDWSQDFVGQPPAPRERPATSQSYGPTKATPETDWSNDFH